MARCQGRVRREWGGPFLACLLAPHTAAHARDVPKGLGHLDHPLQVLDPDHGMPVAAREDTIGTANVHEVACKIVKMQNGMVRLLADEVLGGRVEPC